VGTLECPPGFQLDIINGFCIPEDPLSQASEKMVRPVLEKEVSAPFRTTAKMERCIQDVKANLRKSRKGMDSKAIKSSAIAICRSRLKQ